MVADLANVQLYRRQARFALETGRDAAFVNVRGGKQLATFAAAAGVEPLGVLEYVLHRHTRPASNVVLHQLVARTVVVTQG
jgi:hypothetical protein